MIKRNKNKFYFFISMIGLSFIFTILFFSKTIFFRTPIEEITKLKQIAVNDIKKWDGIKVDSNILPSEYIQKNFKSKKIQPLYNKKMEDLYHNKNIKFQYENLEYDDKGGKLSYVTKIFYDHQLINNFKIEYLGFSNFEKKYAHIEKSFEKVSSKNTIITINNGYVINDSNDLLAYIKNYLNKLFLISKDEMQYIQIIDMDFYDTFSKLKKRIPVELLITFSHPRLKKPFFEKIKLLYLELAWIEIQTIVNKKLNKDNTREIVLPNIDKYHTSIQNVKPEIIQLAKTIIFQNSDSYKDIDLLFKDIKPQISSFFDAVLTFENRIVIIKWLNFNNDEEFVTTFLVRIKK